MGVGVEGPRPPPAHGALLIAFLLACTTPLPIEETGGETPLGDCSSTWEASGQPFVLDYCTGCHSSHLSGEARRGAPGGVDLDTVEGVRSHADRVAARVTDGTMPPGGGPGAEELTALRDWLDCGAPGKPAQLPWTEFTNEGEAWAVIAWPRISSDFPEGIVLYRESDDGGALLLAEWYLVDEDEAWLTAWEDERRSVTYDPPLPIWRSEASWTSTTTATVTRGDEQWNEEQTWTATRGFAEVDPRVPDPDAVQIHLVEDKGDEHLWQLSSTKGTVSRFLTDESGTWWTQQAAGDFGTAYGEGFPLLEGELWAERVLWQAP